jgi:hypothetical protein
MKNGRHLVHANKGFSIIGYKQSSDSFMLDGIPHIKMTWTRTFCVPNVCKTCYEKG